MIYFYAIMLPILCVLFALFIFILVIRVKKYLKFRKHLFNNIEYLQNEFLKFRYDMRRAEAVLNDEFGRGEVPLVNYQNCLYDDKIFNMLYKIRISKLLTESKKEDKNIIEINQSKDISIEVSNE